MAPVTWNRGPWASRVPQPYQGLVPTQNPPSAATPYESITGGEAGAGVGGAGRIGTGEYGPMTGPEMAGMWGGSAARSMMSRGVDPTTAGILGYGAQKAQGVLTGALMGAAPTLSSFVGPTALMSLGPKLGVTLASLLSSALGGVRGRDPWEGLGEMDIQGIRDQFGAFAADEAAREAREREAQYGLSFDIAGSRAYGPRGYAETAPANPVSNPSIDRTQPGWGPGGWGPMGGGGSGGPSGGDAPGTEAGGPEGSGESGPGTGGTRGEAKGGVKTFKKPSRPLVGEAGKEKGIFIPGKGSRYDMTKPGFQGNERQVRKGLKSAYSSLTGGGRR